MLDSPNLPGSATPGTPTTCCASSIADYPTGRSSPACSLGRATPTTGFRDETAKIPPLSGRFNCLTTDFQAQMPLIKNRYLNAVREVDTQIGRLLQHPGKPAPAGKHRAVVVLGDHGEEFMERSRWGHNTEFNPHQTGTVAVLSNSRTGAPCRPRHHQPHRPARNAPAAAGRTQSAPRLLAGTGPARSGLPSRLCGERRYHASPTWAKASG